MAFKVTRIIEHLELAADGNVRASAAVSYYALLRGTNYAIN
jgi:hypothetical protein